ncbi:MAG: hypothetical protein L6W00_18090 [Lentisphaeria bacterium]|nr:MAG: hypothetical protein L6W00_18090 [Lentisphaeria bacterium]
MVLPEVTTFDEARQFIREQAEEIEKLSNELAWFKRQMFGSKTEHYIPEDNTPSLFPEEESPEPSKEVQTATVSEHERKVRQPNELSEIPADLPREERVIDVPEEERLGMVLIGYEESERIVYRTGLYVIHFKRAKYADPSDTLRGVVTAPAPGMCLIQSAAEPVMTPLSLPKLLRIKWRMPSPGTSGADVRQRETSGGSVYAGRSLQTYGRRFAAPL